MTEEEGRKAFVADVRPASAESASLRFRIPLEQRAVAAEELVSYMLSKVTAPHDTRLADAIKGQMQGTFGIIAYLFNLGTFI